MPTTKKKTKSASSKTAPRAQARRSVGFDLKKFYKQLDIPRAEQPLVAESLECGLQNFYAHLYGKNKEVQSDGIRERMQQPFVFGFGAVQAARAEELALETRLKVVGHAIDQIDVEAEYGLPHGLPAMLSFLAGAGRLESGLFRSVMIAADFETELFDDWPLDEVQTLLDWVLAAPGLPETERLWWAWYVSLHCEPPSLCRSLAEILLAHADLSPEQKRALCQAWLTDTPAGRPPALWEATQALLRGDVEAFAQAAAAAGMTVPEKLPTAAEIEADYDAALETLLGDGEGDETPPLSFTMLRRMLVGPMGISPVTPGAYKREALFALAGLGEDPLALCQKYLDSGRGEYYADALNLGVLDVLSAHAPQMPKAEVRALLERALKVGAVSTRKAAYQLGAELWGAFYVKRAAADSAKVIRDWAAKKTAPALAPARRGRRTA
jgi:hypothetical protein